MNTSNDDIWVNINLGEEENASEYINHSFHADINLEDIEQGRTAKQAEDRCMLIHFFSIILLLVFLFVGFYIIACIA